MVKKYSLINWCFLWKGPDGSIFPTWAFKKEQNRSVDILILISLDSTGPCVWGNWMRVPPQRVCRPSEEHVKWKEVPAAQVSCGPAFTHTELKPTWLSTSSNHGGGGSSTNYGGVISQVWGVIRQVWVGGSSAKYGGGHQASMGRGVINQLWGGSSAKYGGDHQPSMGRGVINQLWGGHQPSMEGVISQVWVGGVINQVWVGGSSTKYG